MTITICGSMAFSQQMLDIQQQLESRGHKTFISSFALSYSTKDQAEIQRQTIIDKNEHDAIKEHWEHIKVSDAILVLNYDRKGIANYIGGNSLLEIGFAHVLDKKIFLLQPIPEIEYYQSEIEATKPIILNGDLSKLLNHTQSSPR